MKRLTLIVLSVCLVAALTPVPAGAGLAQPGLKASRLWEWIGPRPQGNSLLAVDFLGPTGAVGWAVGAAGTVVKTTDGGITWIQQGSIAPPWPSGADVVYDLTDVCFVDANHGWIVGANRVWRTTNGGTTWSECAPEMYETSGNPLYWQDVDFASATHGILVGRDRIWRTTNGGASWTACANPGGLSVRGVSYPSAGGDAYIWGIFEGYLKSANGGASWTHVTPTANLIGTNWVQDIAAPNGSTAYASLGNLLMKSTTGGSSWTTMTAPLDITESAGHLRVADGDLAGGTCWAFTDAGRVLKTTDGGATPWTYVGTLPGGFADVDVPGSSIRAIGNGIGVWMSSDGTGWTNPQDPSWPTDGINDIEMRSATSGFMAVDDQLWRTDGDDKSWATVGLITGEVNLMDIGFLEQDGQKGWVVGGTSSGAESVFRTADGGANWAATGATISAACADFFDSDTGWAGGFSVGQLFSTSDGGTVWQQVTRPGYTYRDIEFINATTGWMCGEASGSQPSVVLKTTNAGSTWTTHTIDTGVSVQAIDFVDASYGWGVDQFGFVHKTTNGGVTWTMLLNSPGGNTVLNDVKFVNRLEGWVSGTEWTSFLSPSPSHGVVFHTTDGGATWDTANSLSNGGATGSDSGNAWLSALDGDTVYATAGSGLLRGTTFPTRRISGNDRYAVAANLAKTAHPNGYAGVRHVIVASGEDARAADPLTAAGLAGIYRAPVLLVNGADALQRIPAATDSVINAIVAANPGKEIYVHVVGGTASVPAWVMTKLNAKARVTATDRIAGADRYAVAANISARMRSVLGAGYPRSCFVVNGANAAYFYDALAASPVAVKQKWPVLLVSSTAVPGATAGAKNYYSNRYVVGNTSAVPAGVYSAVGGDERFTASPGDRYGNARDLASDAAARGWVDRRNVGVANKLADALTGGSAMGLLGGSMMFCSTTSLPSNTVAGLRSVNGTTAPAAWAVKRAYVIGGPVSVNDAVLSATDSTLRPAR